MAQTLPDFFLPHQITWAGCPLAGFNNLVCPIPPYAMFVPYKDAENEHPRAREDSVQLR